MGYAGEYFMKYLVIFGKKQTGKDTSANYLQTQLMMKGNFNYGSVITTAFAYPLKKMCEMLFVWTYAIYGKLWHRMAKSNWFAIRNARFYSFRSL